MINTLDKVKDVYDFEKVSNIKFYTSLLVNQYLKERGFTYVDHRDIPNIVYRLNEVYTKYFLSEYVKKLSMRYNNKKHIMVVDINFQGSSSEEKIKLDYDIAELEDEYKKNYKELDEIILEDDGRIRFAGNFISMIKRQANDLYAMELYDNKYSSNMYNTIVYYEGDMADGLPNGNGKLVWKDGKILFEGEFKDGQVSGYGKSYFLTGGVSEEGNWENGIKNGEVVWYYENGQISYKGSVKDGDPHGYGTSFYEDGCLEYKGKWDEGWAIDGLIRRSKNGVLYRLCSDGSNYLVDTEGNNIKKVSNSELKQLIPEVMKKCRAH